MFRKFFRRKKPQLIASHPVGQIFPWAAGYVLKPLDPVTIAIPQELFADDIQIGAMILCDGEAETTISENGTQILLRMKPGMTATIRKNSQALLVDD